MKKNSEAVLKKSFIYIILAIVLYHIFANINVIFIMINEFLIIIKPFLIAILIAYILYMPCKKVEEYLNKIYRNEKLNRKFSVLLIYILSGITLYITMKVFLPFVIGSIEELIKNLPIYFNEAENYVKQIDKDSIIGKLELEQYFIKVRELNVLDELKKYLNVTIAIEQISKVTDLAKGLVNLIISIVVSVYFLIQRENIYIGFTNLVDAFFNKKRARIVKKYITKVNFLFFNYLTGQFIDGIIVGILAGIIMLILKVKYAIPLGIFIGLFNLIPYFGAIIAIVVSAIIILLTGGLAQCLIAITVVTIMQQVDANFINPKIVSMNIDVSPVVVMLGVTIGGAYFGTIGMFLGVPFIAIIKIIFEDIIANKLQKNRILDIIHPKNRLNFNKNNNLDNIKYTYNSNKNLKYHLEKIKERLEKINKNKENKIILDIVNNNRQYKIMKKNIKKPNKINKRND